MSTRRFVLLLALIATVAFVGRAGYILAETRWQHRPVFARDVGDVHRSFDEYYYSQGAIAFADGQGMKFSAVVGAPVDEQGLHPPLTSVLLAPAARVTGGNETSMRFTVALAGVGVVILVGLIGSQVAGRRAGLLAAGLAAIYPNLWVNDGILLAETFATLWTAATIFFTYRLLRRHRFVDALAAGVAAALAMLTRSELALLLPLLVVPAVLLSRLAWRRRLALAGVACLAAVVTIGPWVAYDLSRFDEPVFLSYGAGDVLVGANCADTYAGPRLGYWNAECDPVGDRPGDRSVVAAEKRRVGVQYMREHLDELPLVVAARVGRIWSVFHPMQMARDNQYEGRPLWVSVSGLVMFVPLAGLAIVGAITLRRRRVPLTPLLAPIVIATLSAAAFYGLLRFRAPAEVSLVALAAVALDAWIRRRSRDEPPNIDLTPAEPPDIDLTRVEAPTPGGVESGPQRRSHGLAPLPHAEGVALCDGSRPDAGSGQKPRTH